MLNKRSATIIMKLMPLEKKPIRTIRPAAASFRLSQESVNQLKTLARALNMTQTEIIETVIAEEFEKCKKKYPREFQMEAENPPRKKK